MKAIYTPPISKNIVSEIVEHATVLRVDQKKLVHVDRYMSNTEYEIESMSPNVVVQIDFIDCHALYSTKTHADIENIIIGILRHENAANILLKNGWLDLLFRNGWFLGDISITSSDVTTEVSNPSDNMWDTHTPSVVAAKGKFYLNRWSGNQHVPIQDWLPEDDIGIVQSRVMKNPTKYDSGCLVGNRIGEMQHFSRIVKSVLDCESDGDLFNRYSKKYVNPVWQKESCVGTGEQI